MYNARCILSKTIISPKNRLTNRFSEDDTWPFDTVSTLANSSRPLCNGRARCSINPFFPFSLFLAPFLSFSLPLKPLLSCSLDYFLPIKYVDIRLGIYNMFYSASNIVLQRIIVYINGTVEVKIILFFDSIRRAFVHFNIIITVCAKYRIFSLKKYIYCIFLMPILKKNLNSTLSSLHHNTSMHMYNIVL